MNKPMKFLKKYWIEILVVFIFFLSYYVRISGFHYPYLRNIDSYSFYREMQLIYENGHLPKLDNLADAPSGMGFGKVLFYPYFGAYTYKLFKYFIPNLQLWRFLIYFPAILASLSVFPLYIAGKNLYDKKAGLFLSFLMIFNPSMVSRTLGGDPDSDAIVFLITSIVFMCVSFMIKYKSDKKKLIYSSIFAGASFALFAFTWVGYWYLYWITIGYFITAAIFDYIYNYIHKTKVDKKYIEHVGIAITVMTISMLVLAVPYFGLHFFRSTFQAPFDMISQLSPTGGLKGETGQFPNVYVSVAELMSPGGVLKVIATNISEFLLTFGALGYLIWAFFKKKKHIDTASLLISWLLITMYASLNAVRFEIFLAFPLALGSSIFLSKVFRLLTGEDKDVIE